VQACTTIALAVLLNDEKDAWEHYRLAWEIAAEGEGERDWTSVFSRPHLIYPGGTLTVDLMGYSVVGKEVFYDFEFNIARSGVPEDIDILGTNMHGQTRAAAVHMFRLARFRPRIEDGAPIDTPGYRIRRVYPTEPPDDYGSIGLGQRARGAPGNRIR